MKYSFLKKTIDTTKDVVFLVETDTAVLKEFGSDNWTGDKFRQIIDGILSSKNADEDYEYQLEDDLYIISNKDGVLLFDMNPLKLGEKELKKEDLKFSHEEFINFLSDFKKFVEKNR